MSNVSDNPKIYHITHVDNLPGIVAAGGLWSDAHKTEMGFDNTNIGIPSIKTRRLVRRVDCYPDGVVGDYVPFFFCPRSIMLYLFHRDNHPELTYHGGQRPIVHLVASLSSVIEWARAKSVRWAFTPTNAAAGYSKFFRTRDDLLLVDWQAVASTDFREPEVKEAKQAEFLVHGFFPWELVEKVGVYDDYIGDKVVRTVGETMLVSVEPSWYY